MAAVFSHFFPQQKNEKRIREVQQENEILVTKMHALEHSITELADRQSERAKEFSPIKTNGLDSSTHSSPTSQSGNAQSRFVPHLIALLFAFDRRSRR